MCGINILSRREAADALKENCIEYCVGWEVVSSEC